MSRESRSLIIDKTPIHEGTAIFDTAYYRVLWVTEIGDFEVKVEPATAYEVDEEIGVSLSGRSKYITNQTSFTRAGFKALIADGRFDPGPQPQTSTVESSERDQS